MRIDTLSTFPELFDAVMSTSIMGRARQSGILDFHAHNLRDWTHDRHRSTDDDPYGGGPGLVMKCEPIFEAHAALTAELREDGLKPPLTIFLAPFGERFDDGLALELSQEPSLLFVCGHYEGIDERTFTLADKIVSIGDYVLTGGELATLVVIDATVRKIPGVLGAQTGALEESFADGLLEYPHYTRPAVFEGEAVPEVLLSGDHAAIAAWRRKASLARTARWRPDLLENAALTDDERCFLQSLSQGQNTSPKRD